ncbi:cas scaffolding protein family member 4 isoform X1 [Bufo bufo]|uniref:cas scaffolding protein family member 4 isoform X1 n=1 Tax=Bufo bufo TaxID=8384 RepID=UPI001ABE790E|nr:cas scaffolding protein family member 4 isoform X1 [Bufo bufo]
MEPIVQGLGKKNMLAKALYDNKAECSDELAFRKGDILTVLDQNIFGSEGWWRCYLHGRQGLAPANRLQLFTITQNDSSLVQSNYNSLGRQQSSQNIYQVPSAPKIEAGSMYERMENLYVTPATQKPISGDIYQTPICSPAQVYYEKTNSSSSQHLLTLPRASRASNATSIPQPDVYEIPPSKLNVPAVSQRGTTPSPVNGRSLFLTSSEQQIYDIPSSPDTPGRSKVKTPKASNVYDIPPTGTLAHQKNRSETPPVSPQYNTLPNPRKSDWIYDIPLSPERNILKGGCRKISIDRGMVYDVPPMRYGPVHSNCASSQIYDIPPQQNKLSPTANKSLYDVPPSRDIPVPHQNGSLRKGSSTFGVQRLHHVDSKENVYDIPRGSSAGSPPKSEISSLSRNERIYDVPPPLSGNPKPSLHKPDQDRLSVSSSESRTSTLSTSSNASSESFMLSVPDENTTQVTLEPDVAIKKITELQEWVSSSIASLMIFVSSKWRLQENMESNLEDIHRAVDSIVSSLEQFIGFAQSIKVNASHLTDTNIQMRINNQLQTLTDSLQTLSQNQEVINLCNWSLQALVINKSHTTPDDLDKFVMVARTIPDDIKRFVSIIIANGKLLFKKPENEKKLKPVKEQPVSRKPQVPLRKENQVLRESCVNKTIEKHKDEKHERHQLSRQKAMEDNGYVYLQKKEDIEKTQSLSPIQQLENKTSPIEKRKGWLRPDYRISLSNDPEKKSDAGLLNKPIVLTTKPEAPRSTAPVKKIALSEHCYLYFGALQKAICVFEDSISKNETPEVFITHGKLIIMVGQKLVDLLCQDVKANEARNDILLKSSELCSLLKNLAMATKTAAIQYPNTVTMQELHCRTKELFNYTQLFRAMVE